jgi:outer membrane protein, multidrug efflux system
MNGHLFFITPRVVEAILFALIVLVTGCAVGPKYVRPPTATSVQSEYNYASGEWKTATPQANLPKGKWWEIFGDSALNQVETDAVAANQDLKAASARFDEARASADVVFSGLFPRVSAGAAATRQHDSKNRPLSNTGNAAGQGFTYNNFTVPFNFGYELDLWGRLRQEVESAHSRMEADSADLEVARLGVAAEAAADYFAIRCLDAEKALLLKAIDVYSKSLELVRNRRAGGLVSDLDVAQAETILKTTQAQLTANELQRVRFQNALAVLVGKNPSAFRMAENPVSMAPPSIPAGVPSELLERRPDIAAAERRMAGANANIGVAKAAFFPTVSLGGGGGVQSVSTATLFNLPSALWALGASLAMPLFEGGKLRANVRQAKAGYEETVAHYRQIVLSAFAEVENNLAAQTLLRRQYDEELSALQSANKQLQIAVNQYRAGLSTYLNVANAETTQLGLQRALVSLCGEQFVTAIGLVKSIGGSWQSTGGGGSN